MTDTFGVKYFQHKVELSIGIGYLGLQAFQISYMFNSIFYGAYKSQEGPTIKIHTLEREASYVVMSICTSKTYSLLTNKIVT